MHTQQNSGYADTHKAELKKNMWTKNDASKETYSAILRESTHADAGLLRETCESK
jgi:hypothetical protein